ncbi:MAG: D-glycero-beta-D-manno-heptose 1-phosphate adenylyltransferase [Alphaproteobacteria bacterium]|nr:D-glycero-beta-D-manno-heptose 1-phosphate adenylyltransferase [Alphaproteobacteria bacterium]
MGGADIAGVIDRLTDAVVVCVGDLMLDRFVEGKVSRISPEAPIPILQIARRRTDLGGVGNVARNLAALGATTRLFGAVGRDAEADEVRGVLRGLPRLSAELTVLEGRPTTVKTRFMAGTQQLLRTDDEGVGPLDAEARDRLVEAASAALDGAGALVLSDYGKGVVCEDVAARLIAAARAAGVPVVCDPKGRDFTKYRGAQWLTPNRAELALASGLPVADGDQVVAACAHIVRTAGVDGLLATRSEQGMTLFGPGGASHLPTRARAVFDVAGAGDTVVAALAAGLAGGAAPDAAAQLANQAAGVVVGKVGTAVAYPEEILAAAHEAAWIGDEAKVAPLAAACDRVAAWRRQGQRVGFTNGCFDLLHPGHLALIRQARAACDRLVVGLNSDASVRRLKGPERPVQSEAARAAVLASLAAVDLVVIFADDTPLEVIRALTPDLLVKGADYAKDAVVGAREVESWGGRVLLADLLDGHSTSATLKRLNGR